MLLVMFCVLVVGLLILIDVLVFKFLINWVVCCSVVEFCLFLM